MRFYRGLVMAFGLPVLLLIGWLFFGWDPTVFVLLLMPGVPLFACGISAACEDMRCDPNADRYDNIIDMIRGFPDDWKWKEFKDKNSRGIRYSLHENIIILMGKYLTHGRQGNHWRDEFRIRVYEPSSEPAPKLKKDGKRPERAFTDYDPKEGYQDAIRDAIADLRHYHEMKVFVNVALDADKRKSPADTAQEALDKFKAKAKVGGGTEQVAA